MLVSCNIFVVVLQCWQYSRM